MLDICRGKRVVMLNGLAAGGDLVCAEVAVELGIEIHAALPMREAEYVNADDFPPQAAAAYNRVCQSGYVTKKLVVGRSDESTPASRDEAFRAQMLYVVNNCTVLLALWDGTPSDGGADECGTNAAVSLALSKAGGAVISVFAPREGRTYDGDIREVQYLLHGTNGGEQKVSTVTRLIGGRQ